MYGFANATQVQGTIEEDSYAFAKIEKEAKKPEDDWLKIYFVTEEGEKVSAFIRMKSIETLTDGEQASLKAKLDTEDAEKVSGYPLPEAKYAPYAPAEKNAEEEENTENTENAENAENAENTENTENVENVENQDGGVIADNGGDDDNFELDNNGYIYRYKGTGKRLVLPKTVGGVTVAGIGEAVFKGNNVFEQLIIPDGFPDLPANVFENCTALESVDIPQSMTEIVAGAFKGCTKLKFISWMDKGITKIGNYAFAGCTSLGVVSIPVGVTEIQNNAFEGCSGIEDLDMMDATGLATIGAAAFKGCSGIKKIVIPDTVSKLGNSAFEGCSGAKELTITNGITTIERATFKGCSGLKSLEFPSNITTIGPEAFMNCSGLDYVKFVGSAVSTIWQDAFKGVSANTVMYMMGISTIDIKDGGLAGIIVGDKDQDPHKYAKDKSLKFVTTEAHDYVERGYQYLLNRSSTYSEKTPKIRALANGTTAAQTVKTFWDSEECVKKRGSWDNAERVKRMYQVMHNRTPDSKAQCWIDALDVCMTMDYVINGIAISDEHKANCKKWLMTPGTIKSGAYRDKKEAVTKFVHNAYAWAYYKGDKTKVTASQVESGCKKLLKSKYTAYKFVHGLLTSKKFKKQKTDNATYVKRLYQIYLNNNNPSTAKINKYVKKVKKKGRTWVEKVFAKNKNFKKRMKNQGIKNI